jgi:hypothetical protein
MKKIEKISIKLENLVRDAIKGMINFDYQFYFDDVCYFDKKNLIIFIKSSYYLKKSLHFSENVF